MTHVWGHSFHIGGTTHFLLLGINPFICDGTRTLDIEILSYSLSHWPNCKAIVSLFIGFSLDSWPSILTTVSPFKSHLLDKNQLCLGSQSCGHMLVVVEPASRPLTSFLFQYSGVKFQSSQSPGYLLIQEADPALEWYHVMEWYRRVGSICGIWARDRNSMHGLCSNKTLENESGMNT